MIAIFVIFLVIATLFFIGPFISLRTKIFDDNDQVTSKLNINNSRGKGYFNEKEEILISIGSDKVGYNLVLDVSVDTETEDIKLIIVTKTDYLAWNVTAQTISVLEGSSIFNHTFENDTKVTITLTQYLISLIPNDFYFVFTNTTTWSDDYNVDDVDIYLTTSLFRSLDFVWGILFIFIGFAILILPLWIQRKIRKQKEKKQAEVKKTYETEYAPPPEADRVIGIKRQYEYFGGFVRVKVKVENNTNNVISEVKLMFDLPKAFKLMSIQPQHDMLGDTILLGTLQPLSSKTLALTLEPLICGDEKIHGSIRYIDKDGNLLFVSMNDLAIKVTCPLFFTEEDANIARLKNLKERVLDKKDERSYAIPNGLDFSKAATIIKEVIGMHDVKLVFEEIRTSPKFFANVWYFGRTKIKKNEFVIEGTVSEQNNSIKIAVACMETLQLVGLLAELGSNLRKKILETGIIRTEGELKALRCPACAGPLNHYPSEPGETVRCPWCEFLIVVE